MVSNFKQKGVRDKHHLDFIRSLPCLVCKSPPRSQACHIRRGTDGGMGMKPSDFYTLPMCGDCHHHQHTVGELKFWYGMGGYEAATVLAKELYKQTGNTDAGLMLIVGFK